LESQTHWIRAQPAPSAVPAGEDAYIKLITLAMEKGEDRERSSWGLNSPLASIYLFFQYDGM